MQCSQRVPPARLADYFANWQRKRLVVRALKEPAPVGLLPARHELHGLAHARVGRDTRAPEVVERTENVVMVAGREGELAERRMGDLARRAPPEEAALEQVLLAALPCCRDLRRRPNRALVLEQTLEHADRGVE
jgi:hypothetical protein